MNYATTPTAPTMSGEPRTGGVSPEAGSRTPRWVREEEEAHDVVLLGIETLFGEHRDLLARHGWDAKDLVDDLKRHVMWWMKSLSGIVELGIQKYDLIVSIAQQVSAAVDEVHRSKSGGMPAPRGGMNWIAVDQLMADQEQLRAFVAEFYRVASAQTPCRHCGHTIVHRRLRDVAFPLRKREWFHQRGESEACLTADWQPGGPWTFTGKLAEPVETWWRITAN